MWGGAPATSIAGGSSTEWPTLAECLTKKTPGQRPGEVKQGGFTSGRRGIMRIPSFERDQPKLFVSKTCLQPIPRETYW